MVGLKDKCRHPKTGELYIIKGSGGKNNSPEGHDVSSFFHMSVLGALSSTPVFMQVTVLAMGSLSHTPYLRLYRFLAS